MYNIRVDHIAEDIPDSVRTQILQYLQTYAFPYVTSVQDKNALRALFLRFFTERRSYEWLKEEVYALVRFEGRSLRGVAAVAFTEPNRIHTMVLGEMLLQRGVTTCSTTHTYGMEPMQQACRDNLEGKVLDVKSVLNFTCPSRYDDLLRTDRPMIPQHINCRHVMVPPKGVVL